MSTGSGLGTSIVGVGTADGAVVGVGDVAPASSEPAAAGVDRGVDGGVVALSAVDSTAGTVGVATDVAADVVTGVAAVGPADGKDSLLHDTANSATTSSRISQHDWRATPEFAVVELADGFNSRASRIDTRRRR